MMTCSTNNAKLPQVGAFLQANIFHLQPKLGPVDFFSYRSIDLPSQSPFNIDYSAVRCVSSTISCGTTTAC